MNIFDEMASLKFLKDILIRYILYEIQHQNTFQLFRLLLIHRHLFSYLLGLFLMHRSAILIS
jgi:hypothetical protein